MIAGRRLCGKPASMRLHHAASHSAQFAPQRALGVSIHRKGGQSRADHPTYFALTVGGQQRTDRARLHIAEHHQAGSSAYGQFVA